MNTIHDHFLGLPWLADGPKGFQVDLESETKALSFVFTVPLYMFCNGSCMCG